MVVKAVVTYLPGEVRFSDALTGIATGASHCALKDAALTIDNKTMSTIKNFAQFGEWEIRTGKKMTLELQLEAPSLEIEALLAAGDILAVGYEGYFGEITGPGVIGVMPALTNIPVLEGSEVLRKCDITGKTISALLEFTAAAPAVDSYTFVYATGVATTDAAYILYMLNNYAKYDAAAGATLVSDDTQDIPLQDIVIIARAWEPTLQQEGSVVYKFEGCQCIQEPGQTLSMETPNVATVRFNVDIMRKSVFVA